MTGYIQFEFDNGSWVRWIVKIALIGGGGFRAPLFVDCALRRAEAIGLDEIALMDVDADQLSFIAPICESLVARSGKRLKVTAHTEVDLALSGADFVVTTLRPGHIEGRIADENIAMEVGVLGQETTGAGGFAMAMRSIPSILDYAERMQTVCPEAWLINFTNPAGLVAQALRNAGHEKVVGICDSANGAQTAAARFAGVGTQEVEAEVFGLNHMSFSRSVLHDGTDILPAMLADEAFLQTTAMSVFERPLIERRGMWINEYLWYFWAIDEALAAQARKGGRGSEIKRLNDLFLPRLKAAGSAEVLDIYQAYEDERSGSYMAAARPGKSAPVAPPEGEGYAGVALDVICALIGGARVRTGLNVTNGGAMPDMAEDDVVEVSCIVSEGRIEPVPVAPMPKAVRPLVHTIKAYERMACDAIARKDRSLAIDCLTTHPLVLSSGKAADLVDRLLSAHARFTGTWT